MIRRVSSILGRLDPGGQLEELAPGRGRTVVAASLSVLHAPMPR
jgi:hypothetical protein